MFLRKIANTFKYKNSWLSITFICFRNTFCEPSFFICGFDKYFMWIEKRLAEHLYINQEIHMWILLCAFIAIETHLMPYKKAHWCVSCDGNRMTLKTARQMGMRRTALSQAQICRLHPGSTGMDTDRVYWETQKQSFASRYSREFDRGIICVYSRLNTTHKYLPFSIRCI